MAPFTFQFFLFINFRQKSDMDMNNAKIGPVPKFFSTRKARRRTTLRTGWRISTAIGPRTRRSRDTATATARRGMIIRGHPIITGNITPSMLRESSQA